MAGVRLDVDRFKRVVEARVAEGHIIDTVIFIVGRDGSNGQADAKPDVHIAHNHIFCAIGYLVMRVAGFDRDCIVIICDVQALDQDVAPVGVYTIRVQREHRQRHIV
mmetsp:Transcript_20805/g.28062  ORF Transcript_20805/g.28062 Transcript_20805/m.28062 type:complete len:107 (-) Transcript_20805:267-587(-)